MLTLLTWFCLGNQWNYRHFSWQLGQYHCQYNHLTTNVHYKLNFSLPITSAHYLFCLHVAYYNFALPIYCILFVCIKTSRYLLQIPVIYYICTLPLTTSPYLLQLHVTHYNFTLSITTSRYILQLKSYVFVLNIEQSKPCAIYTVIKHARRTRNCYLQFALHITNTYTKCLMFFVFNYPN